MAAGCQLQIKFARTRRSALLSPENWCSKSKKWLARRQPLFSRFEPAARLQWNLVPTGRDIRADGGTVATVKSFVNVNGRAAADGDGVAVERTETTRAAAESERGVRRVDCADERRTAAVGDRGAGAETVNAKLARLLCSIDHAGSRDHKLSSHVDLQAGPRGNVNKAAAARGAFPRGIENSVASYNRRFAELEIARILIVSVCELPGVVRAADGIGSAGGSGVTRRERHGLIVELNVRIVAAGAGLNARWGRRPINIVPLNGSYCSAVAGHGSARAGDCLAVDFGRIHVDGVRHFAVGGRVSAGFALGNVVFAVPAGRIPIAVGPCRVGGIKTVE